MKAESKATIINRYYGVKCLYVGGVGLVKVGSGGWNLRHPDLFLKLKPLSSISVEDAKLLEYWANDFMYYDIARQLGYATPQTVIEDGKVVTYSVEELVNEGVFKLD